MIVVDASAMIELLMLTPAGLEIAEKVFASPSSAGAPELIDVEVAQVLRRYESLGDISSERAEAALEDLSDFRLRRYPHLPLLPRIWELRHNLTSYDAAYVALAEGLDAVVLTRDQGLASALHRARVEVF